MTGLKTLQYGSIITFLLTMLNSATNQFPALAGNRWVLIATSLIGLLSTFLPSTAGAGHAVFFGEAQAPADRTPEELSVAAKAVTKTIVDQAVPGSTVTVPTAGSTLVKTPAGVAKSFLVLLMLSLAVPAFAQAPPVRNGLIDVGLVYQEAAEGAKTPSLAADALAPFYGHLYIGPEVRLNHQDAHVNFALGALTELQFGSPHVQPFLSLDALYWTGDKETTGSWQASGGGGIRLGGDRFYVRFVAARVEAFSAEGGRFGTAAYSGGFGWRL